MVKINRLLVQVMICILIISIMSEGVSAKVVIDKQPSIEKMALDPIEDVPNIDLSSTQIIDWGVEFVNAPYMWRHSYTGKNVKVAIIDTGVDINHPDLKKNIRGGISFVKNTKSYQDDNGHGTHVAGIVGAVNNNIGFVGVAPDVNIYAVKILDKNGEGTLDDLVKGIDWSIKNKMDIINMSIGLSIDELKKPSFKKLEKSINDAYKKGILLIGAAGNDSKNTVDYPAMFNNVIAVSSMVDIGETYTPRYKLSYFSNYGNKIEFSAPGGYIFSTYPFGMETLLNTDGYEVLDGTSMATPFVSGFLALLKQKYPKYTNIQLRKKMQYYTKDLGSKGKDKYYGYGAVQSK